MTCKVCTGFKTLSLCHIAGSSYWLAPANTSVLKIMVAAAESDLSVQVFGHCKSWVLGSRATRIILGTSMHFTFLPKGFSILKADGRSQVFIVQQGSYVKDVPDLQLHIRTRQNMFMNHQDMSGHIRICLEIVTPPACQLLWFHGLRFEGGKSRDLSTVVIVCVMLFRRLRQSQPANTYFKKYTFLPNFLALCTS